MHEQTAESTGSEWKKNSCALAVVATARCKAQSTSLYIHQTILCLTSPINWQLKGLATSALILISHPLPSLAIFLPHKAFHRAVKFHNISQAACKVSLKLHILAVQIVCKGL